MLRVAKPTSPMSVGTWIIAAYSPGIGLAAVGELLPARWPVTRLVRRLSRPASLTSAALAPALAGYTAVLLSQTAVPAWNTAHPYLPFVFTGSAAASSGGLAMVLVPTAEAGPARAFAGVGAAAELVASRLMEHRIGMVAEAYTTGKAHQLRKWSEYLTAGGLVGTLLARRSRLAAVGAGLALMGGSVLQRFGVFAAGVASTRDPRYVVTPQRERLARREPRSARSRRAQTDTGPAGLVPGGAGSRWGCRASRGGGHGEDVERAGALDDLLGGLVARGDGRAGQGALLGQEGARPARRRCRRRPGCRRRRAPGSWRRSWPRSAGRSRPMRSARW